MLKFGSGLVHWPSLSDGISFLVRKTSWSVDRPPSSEFRTYTSLEYRGVDATSSAVNSPFVALLKGINYETVEKRTEF